MNRLSPRIGSGFWHRKPSPFQPARLSGFLALDITKKIEEERMRAYEKGLYYPVRLGDVFRSRYRVISKLGFGANSTVWFCRDIQYSNLHFTSASKLTLEQTTEIYCAEGLHPQHEG